MMSATLPALEPRGLFRRLARLRRRLRVVAGLRGLFALAFVLIGGAAVMGFLDWKFQLPGLVRAIGLVGILAAAGFVIIRWLIEPFRQSVDDLHLALRMEEKNPDLNDALASAVQFLDQPAEDESSSPLLRRVAIKRAIRLADECNFNDLISLRGLLFSGFGLSLALAAAIPPALFAPTATKTAMIRLLAPFGAGKWPAQTNIKLIFPDRSPYKHPLGDPLEIRAELTGVIPERATLSVWFDGTPPSDQTWIVQTDEATGVGTMAARLEASRIGRSFRFRLKANDGETGWQEVQVLPPPELVPLDGRPSPQIVLDYPKYTDLPLRQLPDGGSSFEAVAGTNVHLRAATSRPIARSWVVYRAEHPAVNTAAAFLSLGAATPFGAAMATAAGEAVWGKVPVRLDRGGTLLEVAFTPRISGVYALRFEDETGFGATRLIDARIEPDPAPLVSLDRPSATRDSLNVTPNAELPLKSAILDPTFAVRSAWLEYRTGKETPRSKLHYDHQIAGTAMASLFNGVGGVFGPSNLPVRLRLPQILVDNRLHVAQYRHPDGSELKPGDVLVIQMFGDDFDDVTGDKQPGRSHELELRIVSPSTLEALLNKDQAEVRQNLLRMQQWQKEAREKTADARTQKDATGKLRPEDLEKLLQAEQLQQQLRARLGDDKEGLRSEVERIRQAQQDNKLPRSPSRDRMEAVANELDRLGREELQQIEPLLNAVRESANASEQKKPDQQKPGDSKTDPGKEPLAEALKHQQEVEQTLRELLQRMEPWSGANEVRGETRALLNEQEKVNQQTADLEQKLPPGSQRERLQDQQRADLDRTASRQQALSDQAKQLLDKMERLAKEKEAQSHERLKEAEKLESQSKDNQQKAEQSKGTPQERQARTDAQKQREQAQEQRQSAEDLQREADALKEAAKTGRQELTQSNAGANQQSKMQQASQDVKENKLGEARQKQQESAKTMQKMLDRLEERRTDDLDRLAKKMKELEGKIDNLADKQDRLQKKAKEAQQIANPEERKKELERLAREQEKLRQEAKELAQELSRLQARDAAQQMNRAARGMEDAQQRLERGEKADESQDDALDRLDDAEQQVEQARREAEDELMREKAEKYAVKIKNLRDRVEAEIEETKRIHEKAMKAKKWEQDVLLSLNDRIDVDRGLADELMRHVEGEFKPIKVAAKILEMSADALKLSASKVEFRRDDIKNRPIDEPFDPVLEDKMQSEILKWQRTALRRLDQFLDALKPDKQAKRQGGNSGGGGGAGGGAGGSGGGGRGGEDIPLLAQLKALRALQAEINERTEQFAKEHPDLSKLKDDEKLELESLRKTQRDVADLIAEFYNAADNAKGEKP